ncbi:MAG: PQQ-binding-like beta-propeller repeat protein [Pirellulaceae bacterium]|nr:PQQ-binding-like beta-propeller repeat protein [Pirellulaceae bacterium]
MYSQTTILLSLLTLAFCSNTFGQVVQRFRGPDATGVVADDPRLPDTWSSEENVKWKTTIPGWGWSSPIVFGNRVFVTSVVNDEDYEKPKPGLYLGFGRRKPPEGEHHWMVHCLDLETGELLWSSEAHAGEPQIPRHPKSTYASETPVTDGKRLYVLFGDVGLYCYDLEGTLLWSQEIEPKKTLFGYGAAASPVVHDDLVIMVYDNMEDSYIAAFDAETGEEKWKKTREEKSTWATPFVWKHDLRTEVIVPGKNKTRSYDLEGNELWSLKAPMSNLVIPSPFAANGLLYVTSGYIGDKERPVYAIKPGAEGEIVVENEDSESEFLAWHLPQAGPYNTSPIVYHDAYYTLYDRGFLTSHNAENGEEIYGKKRFAPGASFTASPWAYNGKLFFLSEEGDTYVVSAEQEFDLIKTNSLDELCIATPYVSQGNLLIRTATQVYCLTNPTP